MSRETCVECRDASCSSGRDARSSDSSQIWKGQKIYLGDNILASLLHKIRAMCSKFRGCGFPPCDTSKVTRKPSPRRIQKFLSALGSNPEGDTPAGFAKCSMTWQQSVLSESTSSIWSLPKSTVRGMEIFEATHKAHRHSQVPES
jgi:hypothetical protein